MRDGDTCDVSIIVPVLNEVGSVPRLAGEIGAAFESAPWVWECVWVDDGSSDGTLEQLRALNREDPRHRFVAHEKNYGQSAALVTGFSRSSGRILATLDGDLQNDPADLPRLIRALEEGSFHMVNGVRANRRDSWLRRVSSRVANGFRNRMSGATATDVGCSVRAFYRTCIEGVPHFHGMHRFLPTLVTMRGWRVTEIDVNHRPRTHGATKYGVHNRLWVGIADTFGVRWLSSRGVNASVAEASGVAEITSGAETSTEPAPGCAATTTSMESDANDD
ncbi:glycosyltransferase family 2 protein [bacterium]|nr:glycosyltransferase family 2 protein [bacterium]